MATFSSLHNFNLSNSSSPSSTTIDSNNMSTLLDETKNANFFSQFCQVLHEKTLDHSTNISPHYYTNDDDDNDNNGTRVSSSIVTDHKYEVTQKINANKRKSKEPSFANCAQSKGKREVRRNKQKKMKDCEEMNKSNKEEEKEAPKGYVHVRARRGQATDRHSLAERVRREKIGERMKLLQALVPGCDKVTGKALILDVIINYVQSLQNQVEFLSMKLASVNSMFYDLGMDLESFMVMLDENLSDLPQEYSPRAANYNYPLIENFANSFLFEQDQSPNVFPQENRQVLWEVDEQRQRSINQSGFNNNMFLFN